MLGFCIGGGKPLTRLCELTLLVVDDVACMSEMLFRRFTPIKIYYMFKKTNKKCFFKDLWIWW